MKQVKEELSSEFDVKDLGKLRYFFQDVYCPESEGEENLDGTTYIHRETSQQDWDE